MLKSMLEIPGVIALVQYKDGPTADLMEAHGSLEGADFKHLARFASDHKRMTQGMIDVFALFSPSSLSIDWTPIGGWVVRGKSRSVCGWAGLVCLIDNEQASLNQVLKQLSEVAFLT